MDLCKCEVIKACCSLFAKGELHILLLVFPLIREGTPKFPFLVVAPRSPRHGLHVTVWPRSVRACYIPSELVSDVRLRKSLAFSLTCSFFSRFNDFMIIAEKWNFVSFQFRQYFFFDHFREKKGIRVCFKRFELFSVFMLFLSISIYRNFLFIV